MKMMVRIALAISVSSIAVTGAHAQDVQSPTEDGAAGSQGSDSNVIVITANKREQDIQTVSIPVTALSGDTIRDANVSDLKGLQTLAPSLTIGDDNNVAKIFIRGVGLNTSVTGSEAGVAFHVDGAVISRPEAQLTSFFDVERVEVLRGPQGTLYGRNAVGGAINVITAKPTRDLSGYINATYGNYGRLELEGAISGPVSETLSARVAVRSEDRDGFGVMTGTTRGIDDNNRQMARGQLLWEPSADFSWLVSGDWFKQDDHSGAPHVGAAAFPDPSDPSQSLFLYTGIGGYPTRPRNSAGDFDPFFQAETWAVTSTMSLDVNDWLQIVDIANYRDFEVDHGFDFDVSNVINTAATRGLNTVHKAETSKQFSNELQFQVSTDGVKGVLGFYYFNEKLESKTFYGIIGPGYFGPPENSGGLAGSGIDPVDYFAACGIPELAYDPGDPNPPPNFCAFAAHETDVWAVFGQYLFDLGTFAGLDGLSLKLGGRYTSEKRSVNNVGSFAGAGFAGLIPAGIGSRTFNQFTPEAGLEWQASRDLLLYYTYSEGFKSGVGEGLSPGTARIIDPENITNHEIGIKSTLADGASHAQSRGFQLRDDRDANTEDRAEQSGHSRAAV